MSKIALLFPGQGSQYKGMGKFFYNNYKIAKDIFEESSEVLKMEVKDICFGESENNINLTSYTQPAIFTTNYAMYKVFEKEYGLVPDYLCGHSLGEYSALTVSEAILFQEALNLVKIRGEIMESSGEMGVMAAIVGIEEKYIQTECKKISIDKNKGVFISAINSSTEIIVSGQLKFVEKLKEKILEMGGLFTLLNLSGPFHSPLMTEAARLFKNELESLKINNMKYPVISNVSALPYANKNDIILNLYQQLFSPVLWKDTIDYLLQSEVKCFVEIGPKAVLRNLILNNYEDITSITYDKEMDRTTFKEYIKKRKLDLMSKFIAIAICTKNNNHNDDELYNKMFKNEYKNYFQEFIEMKDKNEEPSQEKIVEGLEMLLSTFKGKNTSEIEIQSRIKQIVENATIKNYLDNSIEKNQIFY